MHYLSSGQQPDSELKHRLFIGQPVVSIDTKKRELVGSFRNAGSTWRREALAVLEYETRLQLTLEQKEQ